MRHRREQCAGLFGERAESADTALWTAFDRWWASYPRREKKADAQKAWRQLRPSPELIAQMMVALVWQKRKPSWITPNWRGELFVPLPASWIRGRRWEDEPLVTPKPSGAWWQQCAHEPPCETYPKHLLALAKEQG